MGRARKVCTLQTTKFIFRDVKDTTVGTLSQRITNQLMGLKGLNQKLKDMHSYLEKVARGDLPMNHEITYHLQVTLPLYYYYSTISTHT